MAQLGSLSTLISQQAQEHLAYPVLHYFHSAEDETALAPRIAALDDALRILRHAVAAEARPADIDLMSLTGSIDVYVNALGSAHISPTQDEPPIPSLDRLKKRGIPLAEYRDIEAAFQREWERRRMLLALVRHDGWDWPHG
ncbi:MAG TPA: hypothetical protein VHG92_10145 [Afifellaceae bacterium]|nr:hypothetical protein [Afifellaceae bacterium]